MKALGFAVLALLAAQCETRPPDPPAPPPPAPTVEPVPTVDPPPPPPEPPAGADRCERGAARAAALGCPLRLESNPQPWVEVCRYYESKGIDLNADCLEVASTCAAVRKCIEEDIR